MTWKLFANRYADYSPGGSDPNETWEEISDLGIRWALPGGIQRIELTIKARSAYDAWRRYRDHLGHTIAVYDTMIDRYIGGQVYEIVPDGRHVTYVCGGWWQRTFDDVYEFADMPTSGNTDAIIEDILTNSVAIDSGDFSNIDATSVEAVPGWSVELLGPKTAAHAIEELAAIGNSSDVMMDFYYVDPGFINGVQMQAPDPYLKARSTTASFDWLFRAGDLVRDGLSLSRNIWDMTTTLYVNYGRYSGSATSTSGAGVLTDSSALFLSHRVRPGDGFLNLTAVEEGEIASVDSQTQLTLTDTGTTITSGDAYTIILREPASRTTSTGTTNYWAVTKNITKTDFDQTMTAQFGDTYVNLYDDAVQRAAFVIGAPTIRAGTGGFYPLWRPFMGDSFYFRLEDFFPEVAVFTSSGDRRQTFIAAAMDYTYRDNRLRVVPSTGDHRLDVLLNQAGLIRSQIIATQTWIRNNKHHGSRDADSFNNPASSYG